MEAGITDENTTVCESKECLWSYEERESPVEPPHAVCGCLMRAGWLFGWTVRTGPASEWVRLQFNTWFFMPSESKWGGARLMMIAESRSRADDAVEEGE